MIVPNAFGALRAINTAPVFDAYVMSFWLPDLAGPALCREIRKIDPHAPVCVLCASNQKSSAGRATSAGADAVLPLAVGAEVLVKEELCRLLHQASIQSMRARYDERQAIDEECERRAAIAIETAENGKALAAQSIERTARIRALKAFVDAGGSRGAFERTWPGLFSSHDV